MSEEWKAYVTDPRTVCKYGAKCYQKNPEHQKHFKHPPKNIKQKMGQNNPAHKLPKKRDYENISNDQKTVESSAKKVNISEESDHTEAETTSTQHENTPNSTVIDIPEKISYLVYGGKEDFKNYFGVDMPPDFFNFYECLKNDSSFKQELTKANLQFIGPFDLLFGKLPTVDEKHLYLVNYRFFYDPPEFQAVLKKTGKSEFHIGYFRDSPDEMPVFLASNDSSKDYQLTPMADNIFGAVYLYLQSEKQSSPFTAVVYQKLMDKVKKLAEEYKYSVVKYNMKTRLTQSVTKSFHGAGIVVPYNKKTQLGYRKLAEKDATIRSLFAKLKEATSQSEKDKVLSELQPVITYANIAVDECDFGTGIEIGIALFCSGLPELQPSALNSLCSVYSLLNRDVFSKIIQTHMKYRRKGPYMSLLGERGE